MRFYSPPTTGHYTLTLDELRAHPVKDGSFKDFDPAQPCDHIDFLCWCMPRDVPLSEFFDTMFPVVFTKRWYVTIGTFPNGTIHEAVIYATDK